MIFNKINHGARGIIYLKAVDRFLHEYGSPYRGSEREMAGIFNEVGRNFSSLYDQENKVL